MNRICETGEWPNNFLNVIMISLKTKQTARQIVITVPSVSISYVGKVVALGMVDNFREVFIVREEVVIIQYNTISNFCFLIDRRHLIG